MSNAAEIIETLDVDQIREQLDELHRQESALRVLLRAAVARESARTRKAKAQKQAGAKAEVQP